MRITSGARAGARPGGHNRGGGRNRYHARELHSQRADRAEIVYWDEAPTLVDAASLALRLWKFKTAYLEGSETPVNDLAFLARHRETLRHLHVHGDQLLDVG